MNELLTAISELGGATVQLRHQVMDVGDRLHELDNEIHMIEYELPRADSTGLLAVPHPDNPEWDSGEHVEIEGPSRAALLGNLERARREREELRGRLEQQLLPEGPLRLLHQDVQRRHAQVVQLLRDWQSKHLDTAEPTITDAALDEFASIVKSWVAGHEVTQAEFARRVRIAPPTLSRYLSTASDPQAARDAGVARIPSPDRARSVLSELESPWILTLRDDEWVKAGHSEAGWLLRRLQGDPPADSSVDVRAHLSKRLQRAPLTPAGLRVLERLLQRPELLDDLERLASSDELGRLREALRQA